MAELQLLTNSRRSSYSDCPRKHFYRYELCRRPAKESDALRFGQLMHGALEHWWKDGGGIAAALAYLNGSVKAEHNEYDIAKARALMETYDLRYSADRIRYKVIGVEVGFRAPLLNPDTSAASKTWELAGKIDVLVEDENGQYAIIEHKTTSDSITPESDYWPRLTIDGQVSGYYVGAEVLGYKVDRCIYDVIHKPGIKPLMATPQDKIKTNKDGSLSKVNRLADESPWEYCQRLLHDIATRPEHYFARRDVVRLEDDLADYMYDMWSTGRSIRESQLAKRWPRNPNACTRFGTCEYFHVCCKVASIDDGTQFVTTEQNPELNQ